MHSNMVKLIVSLHVFSDSYSNHYLYNKSNLAHCLSLEYEESRRYLLDLVHLSLEKYFLKYNQNLLRKTDMENC